MRYSIFALAPLLAACVSTSDLTEVQRIASSAEGFNLAADRCTSQAGGFSDLRYLREQARLARSRAIAAGATEADFELARNNLYARFGTSEFLVGGSSTCDDLLSELSRVAA